MKINRIKFNEILKKCFPIVDHKSSLYEANFDCFLFKNGFIYAYNNYMSIKVKLQDDFDIDYMLINAKILKGIFDKMKGGEIIFIFEDNVLTIKDGAMKAKVQSTIASEKSYGIDSSIEVLENELNEVEWKKIPDNFFQGLNFCLVPISIVTSTYKPGIGIDGCDMYDAAGISLSWFKLSESMDSFFLPDDGINALMKIEGLKNYFLSENWIHFTSDDGTIAFSIRLVDWKMVGGCSRVRNDHLKEGEVFNGFLPETFGEVLDRALLFIEKVNDRFTVRLNFGKKGIIVIAKKPKGEFEEFIAWEGEIKAFEEFSIYVNIQQLQFGLKEKLIFSVFDEVKGKDGEKRQDLSFSNFTDRLFCFPAVQVKGII